MMAGLLVPLDALDSLALSLGTMLRKSEVGSVKRESWLGEKRGGRSSGET